MIERQIVASNVKELEVQEYITSTLKNLGQSHIKLQKTPLGEKIIIYASRPGLIVGRKGQNIKKLTDDLKQRFNLENPQIEINEVENPNLDAQIVAERIASSLEKFGTQRFKGIGHKVMSDVISSGALGIEILISGKIPSARAKRWRFYQGYLKKCGDVAIVGVRQAYAAAQLKTGTVGIQVRIMPPDINLPDKVTIFEKGSDASDDIKTAITSKGATEKDEGQDEKKETKKTAAKKTEKQKDKPALDKDDTKKNQKRASSKSKETDKKAEEKKEPEKPTDTQTPDDQGNE